MSATTAKLNQLRQSPRKVRIVAQSVKGMSVQKALGILSLLPKRSAAPLKKLIESALANAKNLSLKEDALVISEIRVDGGAILYRRRPRSRGMASPIKKRTSHISITLTEKEPPVVSSVEPTITKTKKQKA